MPRILQCILPLAVLLAILIPNIRFEREDVNVREKRVRAAWPWSSGVSAAGWTRFCKGMEAAFNDRFFLRDGLVRMHRRIVWFFGDGGSDRVAVGRDGWLFLRKTLEAYDNMVAYSIDMQQDIGDYLCRLAEFCSRCGKPFVVLIAPDKCRVYPENVRGFRKRQDDGMSRTERLVTYLRGRGISVIYPRARLLGHRRTGEFLYYPQDTHWTPRGAWLGGYEPLAEELRKAGVCLVELKVPTWELRSEPGHDDLREMLAGVSDRSAEEQFAYPVFGDALEVTGGRLRKTTHCGSAGGQAYILRDSFAIALMPYLGRSFGACIFRRGHAIPHEDLPDVRRSDVVILEICERNVERLKIQAERENAVIP